MELRYSREVHCTFPLQHAVMPAFSLPLPVGNPGILKFSPPWDGNGKISDKEYMNRKRAPHLSKRTPRPAMLGSHPHTLS